MLKVSFILCVLCVTVCVTFGQKLEAGEKQREGVECTLPQVSGNCTQQITRYYYDPEAQRCKQFVYSGCNGNLNNFELEDECNMRCICMRPKVEGTGLLKRKRFFYNNDNKQCETFTYRGNGGNRNKFFTRRKCEDTCEPVKAKCKARPEFGRRCERRAPSTMYYYDINSGYCTSFAYQGCGGGKNRFSTHEQCKEACNGRNITKPKPQPDVCFYQPVSGPCNLTSIKYYYDYSAKMCLPFVYSGCGGNGNNFETKDKCNETCGVHGLVDPGQTTTTTSSTTTTARPKPALCYYNAGRGECGFNLKRYYHDRIEGTCKEFYWTGCGGNMNRFTSRELCMLTCVM